MEFLAGERDEGEADIVKDEHTRSVHYQVSASGVLGFKFVFSKVFMCFHDQTDEEGRKL
jgi:hypothetical protein